jgi:uncharacterized membrane protein YtjA (UPF0391 family)
MKPTLRMVRPKQPSVVLTIVVIIAGALTLSGLAGACWGFARLVARAICR